MELHLQQDSGKFILYQGFPEEADSGGNYPGSTLGRFTLLEEALCRAQVELGCADSPGGLFLSGFEEEPQAEL